MIKVKSYLTIFILLCFVSTIAQSQDSSAFVSAGIVYQKSISLYNESGCMIECGNTKILQSKLHFALSITSTRLGSAFRSNALKQESYLFSCLYIFRHKKLLTPILAGNIGLIHVDYGSPIFSDLQSTAALLSPELGLRVNPKSPICGTLSVGCNLLTGDGDTGVGSVVPFFYRLNLLYKLFR